MEAQRRSYLLAGVFFALLLGSVLCVDLVGLLQPRNPFPDRQFSWLGFWSGDNARVLETWLKDESATVNTTRPLYNELLYLLAGTPNPDIVVGRDMLFDSRRLAGHDQAFWDQRRQEMVSVAERIVRTLAPWDGKLVVAMVPDRIRLNPDQLPDLDLDLSGKAKFYADVVTALAGAGAEPVDLLMKFREVKSQSGGKVRLYRRDDHHWNITGARHAGTQIAIRLRALGAAGKGQSGFAEFQHTLPGWGSLLNKMGWRSESPLHRSFAEHNDTIGLTGTDGRILHVPWDKDVALLADSFGAIGLTSMMMPDLGSPISDLTLGGRGAIYSLHQLIQCINDGWRPRFVVWVFEEFASYSPSVRMTGWLLDETLVDAKQGLTEKRCSLEAISADEGCEMRTSDDQLLVTNRRRHFRLRMDRSALSGSHLVFYMRAPFVPRRPTLLALHDAEDPEARRTDIQTRRIHVLDGMELPDPTLLHDWQRVVLPVPPGAGDLILSLRKEELGGEFAFTAFGSLAPIPSPTQNAHLLFRPTSFHRRELGWTDILWTAGKKEPLVSFPLDGKTYFAVWATSTARCDLTPALPSGGRIPLVLAVDGARCPTEASVVFTFRLDHGDHGNGTAPTVLLQKELSATSGTRATFKLDLPLPDNATGAHLRIDVHIPHHVRNHVTAGALFTKTAQ